MAPGVKIEGCSDGGGAQKPLNRERLTCDAMLTTCNIYAQKSKNRLAAPVLASGMGAWISVQGCIDLGLPVSF